MFNQKSGAFIKIGSKRYEIVSNGSTGKKLLEHVRKDSEQTFYASGSICDDKGTVISYKDAVKLKDWLVETIQYVEENIGKDKEVTALKNDIARIENTLKEMKTKLSALESEA